jgi:hypothetical protein
MPPNRRVNHSFRRFPRPRGLHENRDGAALRLEDDPLPVAEVLAVGVKRHRMVADDIDPVEIVAKQDIAFSRVPSQEPEGRSDERAAPDATGATTSSPSSKSASGTSCTAIPLAWVYGEPLATNANAARPSPTISSEGSRWPRLAASEPTTARAKAKFSGTPAVLAPSHLVDPAHRFRVQPDAGGEGEAAPVDAPESDPPRAATGDRIGELPRGRLRLVREAERAGEHARAAARQEADRDVGVQAVQRLVEAAVAGEHDDRVAPASAGVAHDLGRVTRALGAHRHHLAGAGQLALHRRDALLGHPGREGVHDQDDLHLLE